MSVFGEVPVFKPPDSFEPEWLVPADPKLTDGANYVAINKVTGKRYEGESVNFHNRHNDHKNDPFNASKKTHRRNFIMLFANTDLINLIFIFVINSFLRGWRN